ncbi:MAG: hypothetical protein OCC49_03505 [Fibrobacterales bacterium]
MQSEDLLQQRWYRSKGEPLVAIVETLVGSIGCVNFIRYECQFRGYSELYLLPMVGNELAFTHTDFIKELTGGQYTEATLLPSDSTNPIIRVNSTTIIKVSPYVGGLEREREVYAALPTQKGIPHYQGEYHVAGMFYGLALESVNGVSAWDFWGTLSGSEGEVIVKTIVEQSARALARLHLELNTHFAHYTQSITPYIEQVNGILEKEGKQRLPAQNNKIETQVIHGDFHLGQLIIDPFLKPIIIDFEGEPHSDNKNISEVYQIDSMVKCMPREYDIACFLRSLSYAKSIHTNVKLPTNIDTVFVDSYINTFFSKNITVSKKLIEYFTLIRCDYEIAYERKNRPLFAKIPQEHLRVLHTHYP